MLTIKLATPEATAQLGQSLARLLMPEEKNTPLPFQAILLRGPLGSGKTSLTRALVSCLPGGDKAEVSSPSFTLCNAYPTSPEILHCDLYRSAAALPDEVWEALDQKDTLIIIEWAQYVPLEALPGEYLDICLEICESGRLVMVEAYGDKARQALEHFTFEML